MVMMSEQMRNLQRARKSIQEGSNYNFRTKIIISEMKNSLSGINNRLKIVLKGNNLED
jgi:hypothetical protein